MPRFVTLTVCLLLCGCSELEPPVVGSRVIRTEKREVADFAEIELSVGAANLDVKKGDAASMELTWDDNLLEFVETSVVDGVLTIKQSRNTASSDGLKIAVVVPSVSRVSVAGSSKVTIEELSGSKVQLSISGSGDMTAVVNAEGLTCDISGSGTINASGTSPKVSIAITGSGTVNTKRVAAEEVEIDIAGGGKVNVNAEKSLDVSIAGSGDVSYSGKPQISQSVVGSGSITERHQNRESD